MTKKDIDDIIKTICPNDEDFEKPCISPAYLKRELEALALEQEPCEQIEQAIWNIKRGKCIPHKRETLNTIINALERKPCEDIGRYDPYTDSFVNDDCISRQAVLDVVNNPLNIRLADIIKVLPSVTPKEKTGHWIDDADKIDTQFGKHTYKCSECGKYAEYFVSGTEVWWHKWL